jgi:hypothetical protein
MFAMFFYVTFFVQQVLGYSALKAGFAALPIAAAIGVTSQTVSRLLPKFGPKAHIMFGTVMLIAAMLWFSRASENSGYLTWMLPGLIVMGLAMGNLFVPLTLTAVSKVADTDAGLASALLNVGQQVGGSLGLSVLATVATTAGDNYKTAHLAQIQAKVGALGPDLAPAIGARLQAAGNNGLQPQDIANFLASLPAAQRPAAAQFFAQDYTAFGHAVLTQSVGTAFTAALGFAGVALLAAIFMINAKRSRAAAP